MKQLDGKLNGFYRGVVEDNNDPELRGRCKIRMWGVHSDNKKKTDKDGIPTADLPWCEPCLPIMEGAISGFGMFGVPVKGSHVMCFFENGNYHQPRYFAAIPGVPTEPSDPSKGFNDPDGSFPTTSRLNQPDWHRLARGISSETLVETKRSMRDAKEPASPYAAKYPHNWVIVTHGGITIELDSTPNNERLHLYHPSNSYIEIDSKGNMVVKNQKNKFEIVMGSKTEHVVGTKEETIDKDLTINVTGSCTIQSGGQVKVIGSPINLN